MVTKIQKELRCHADKERAPEYMHFFKTGAGEYGEGDLFLGVTVPKIRTVARNHKDANSETLSTLLKSKFHEERLLALIILTLQAEKANEQNLKNIYTFYLAHRRGINNWDLVDVSAHKIVGRFLFDYSKPKDVLYMYAHSGDLWERRIAIIATAWGIKNNEFKDTLAISKILLHDEHDLIHKAVGWMLREVGKKDLKKEEDFLKQHYKVMPRTMLRYAIEKFPERKRQKYLKGKI